MVTNISGSSRTLKINKKLNSQLKFSTHMNLTTTTKTTVTLEIDS